MVIGSGFGPIGAWISTRWQQLQWWLGLKRRFQAKSQAQRQLILAVFDLLERPEYAMARVAVCETAHTFGFNKPETWVKYSRMLKSDLGRQENHYRHIRSVVRTRELLRPSTISNPLVNFATELAYQEYAIQPWKAE